MKEAQQPPKNEENKIKSIQNIFGVELLTCFLVSGFWLFLMALQTPGVLIHFPTATHFSWVTVIAVIKWNFLGLTIITLLPLKV